MPLPEPSEQEGESVRAGQEPAREPGMDVIPAAPRIPKKFPKLVLLAASSHRRHGLGSRPKGTHCVMSLEMSGPDTLARTLQVLPAEEQDAILPSPQAPEPKRSRLDAAPKPLEFLRTPFGGRLLVHESFLYKQEKAVGDKVYWKCREHTELGCRGRAITRGSRVTVMRGHCHPPDEEGLEVRRQREKLPSPALPEGVGGPGGHAEEPLEGVGPWLCPEEPAPGLGRPAPEEEDEGLQALSLLSLPPKKRPTPETGEAQPLEFLRTCYGGSFLVHESFLYKREKVVGDKVYWTCREHTLHACRSRAITQGPRVTIMRAHSHPPDVEGLEARRQQEKAMESLQAQPGGPVDKLLRGVDSLLYRRGPGSLTLTRPRPRNRSKPKDQGLRDKPPAPQGPQAEDQDSDMGGPEFLKTPLGGNFLVHDSFLYRREKAAGDKVYWTCRDQARMGCRSRAITQGPRVTVMRGHSHPPDLGGLEILRQRENHPGPAQRGSSESCQGHSSPHSACPEPLQRTASSSCRRVCGRRRAVSYSTLIPRPLSSLGVLHGAPGFADGVPHGASSLTRVRLGPEDIGPSSPQPAGQVLAQPDLLAHPGVSQATGVTPVPGVSQATGGTPAPGRDQARMGCRSRAITQGPRVMVMRGHSHPPDLGGLEALRQREQFPSLAQREGPGALRPLEFLRTSLGGRFLVHESFLYRKEKAAGDKVYWMCRDQARLGCRSRAITQGPRVTVMRGHCHPPDLGGLEALRQRERLPGLAQQEGPEKIKLLPKVQLCFKTCSPESQQIYGKITSVKVDSESQ
ncbi:FLYWCH-type zinc finger-containing protein 1 [Trichechus manatus latirostris]|uniref:FLYWCH-type zinc finger-containing protein 1 n=1 Tax=Trichechus manatus latirostris TaxID=127582 RepID=A0A2Y9DF19_TRIMA|nr:FLYWCH-type zinc finger-containing protein 1 [Trichechus manatus latirostris]